MGQLSACVSQVKKADTAAWAPGVWRGRDQGRVAAAQGPHLAADIRYQPQRDEALGLARLACFIHKHVREVPDSAADTCQGHSCLSVLPTRPRLTAWEPRQLQPFPTPHAALPPPRKPQASSPHLKPIW